MNNTLKNYYEEILEFRMEELKRRSEYLSRTLSLLVDRIEKDGVKTSINTCGECQSEARIIDDLCKEIGQIRQMLDMIKGYSTTEDRK